MKHDALPSPEEQGAAQRLRHHVQTLAGDIGERNVFHPRALAAAETYIRTYWEGLGYAVYEQRYETRGVACANLEIILPGRTWPERILLVGAHYDSVRGSPGANDNGSGVAVLLELARQWRNREPRHTLRLVAFANEEPPFFLTAYQGSMRYARRARKRGEDIRLMLSLETLGCYRDEPGSQRYPPLFRFFYPDRANFVALVANWRSRRPMRRLARCFRAVSDFPLEHVTSSAAVPGVGASDHFSFWLRRYRAVMVTDTAYYRYAPYHTAEDTPDKLDYPRLARVALGLSRALLAFDGETL